MGKHERIVFVTEAPIIEMRGGVVHIRYTSNGEATERTMSVKTFAKAIERGQRALDRYARGEENVIVDD